MKIREIILEDSESIAQLLKSECAPFINEMGGFDSIKSTPIVRGDNRLRPFSEYIKIQCPTYRTAVDTAPRVHQMTDDWFYRKFGIRFRSNVLFGSGNDLAASFYGRVGLLFPIGEYHYCWSPKYTDLYAMSEFVDSTKVAPKDLETHLENGNYQFDTGLHDAIKNGSEIMFNCQAAYMVLPEIFGIETK